MKPVYSNDRKAPRMRKGKFSRNVVTKELWRQFTEKYEEYRKMPWSEFFTNWKEIAETIREETIKNPLGVKLGSYTGELKLQYLPYKFVSYQHDNEEIGERIKNPNILTKGKVGKIKWERRWAVKFLKTLQFFAFEETRELNHMAKKHLDSNPEITRMARNTLGGRSVWRQFNKKT